jgi:zinc/manganese transport system permease protein
VSQITGVLLVFALLVMPAAAAQRITARPVVSFTLTIAFGLLIVWLGLGVAYFSVYPVGFYVTTIGFALFLFASGYRVAADRLGRRTRGAMAT